MIVWRLARECYAELDGEGARLAGGRWTPKGYPAVYTASSLSLAILEIVVHLELDPDLIPDDYVSLKIEVPDELVSSVRRVESLDSITDDSAYTMVGHEWLEQGEHLLMQVPSVIVPTEKNWIINPRHPDASRVKLVEMTPFSFDERLFR